MVQFTITEDFAAPVAAIFDELADHEAMGRLFNMNMKRIKDADPSGPGGVNGLGSVRSLSIFPMPAFEETITAFEANALIEYSITRGGPLKNHRGRLDFSEKDGRTFLKYYMEFEPKFGLPGTGTMIKLGMRDTISKGLGRLRKRYEVG